MKQYLKNKLRVSFDFLVQNLSHYHAQGFRRLARISLKERTLIILALICSIVSVLFEGGSIGILAIDVNVLLGTGTLEVGSLKVYAYIADTDMLAWLQSRSRGDLFLLLVLSAISAQLLKAVLIYSNRVFAAKVERRICQNLQNQITSTILSMDYEDVIQESAGKLEAKIRLGEAVSTIVLTMNALLSASLLFVAYVALMLALSVTLTIISLIVAIVISIALTVVVGAIRKLGRSATRSLVSIGHITVDYLNAPRLLRLYNAEDKAQSKISLERNTLLGVREKTAIIKAAIEPAIQSATIIGAAILLMMGYFLSKNSAMEFIPQVMMFFVILNRMMPQVQMLNKTRMVIAQNLLSLEEVEKLFDPMRQLKPLINNESVEFNDEVVFSDVSFCYSGTTTKAISNLNLSIKQGSVTALVGSSGGGKSTVIDLFLGLLSPTEGQVRVDGIDIEKRRKDYWRSKIGVVDQETMMLNGSIRDNIIFGREGFNDRHMEDAARIAYAHDFISNLKQGYDTLVGDRGTFLSGGQKQRIAIARSVLANPEIIVLDEPTSALDVESEAIVSSLLRSFAKDKTVLVVGHRESTIAGADFIVLLDAGRLVESGTREELLRPGTNFSKLWKASFPDH